MRILLVQPRQKRRVGFNKLSVVEPLGVETVAACLQDHDVKILDFFTIPELKNTVDTFQPHLFGVSCTFTIDVYHTLEVAQAAKDTETKPFVVVGGHHPTLNPQDFYSDSIDAIIIGEGEITLPEVASRLEKGDDLSDVSGLVINTPEGQKSTRPRLPVKDLDKMPIPNRQLTGEYRNQYYLTFWKPFATIESARGCPFRCNYCSVWKFYQGRCRTRGPERVVSEVAAIKEKYVMFTDDNFLLNVPRAKNIARLLKESGIKKNYIFQSRSDAIVAHPDVVAMWREVGLENIFIGFEGITQESLEYLNKRNTVENNEKALEITNAHDVGITGSFIVNPNYGLAEFETLRRYIRRLQKNFRHFMPSFAVLTPLPGTELAHQIKDRIITTNYELFDLIHAVLPTELSLPDFYKEFASLYRTGYTQYRVLVEGIVPLIMSLAGRRFSISHLKRIMDAVKMLNDGTYFLADHRRREMPSGTSGS